MIPEKDPLAKVDGALPFCCRAESGRLVINLKQREASFSRFRWRKDGRELRVHFFYNRSFARRAVDQRGSYSKTFRPDYTLVIIPEEFDSADWRTAEKKAEQSGRIAYLHFDAKYRGENLPGIFGIAENEDEELEDERSRAAGTVKNPDLYKMHTYNEAIRRTVGSYVLYPGVASKPGDAYALFERYHEIVPGIGAFAVRPKQGGLSPDGLPYILGFVNDVLSHQLSKFTQSYRVSYWTETTLREATPDYRARLIDFAFDTKPPTDTQVLLGFVRDDEGARACHETGTFFCHAVEWSKEFPRNRDGSGNFGEPSILDFDPFRSDLLIVYHHARNAPWVAKVFAVKLVSAAERAAEIGRELKEMGAAYYYRFQLGDFRMAESRDISSIVQRRPGKPIACRLNDFAACPLPSRG